MNGNSGTKRMLEIINLHSYFSTKRGLIRAVDGVSLGIEEGKTLGVVGESGSGKSQTALSILKLFEKNQKIYEGEVYFEGEKISTLNAQEMYKLRGNKISMIFQEPMTSLNPVFTIGKQIGEVLLLHQGMTGRQARERSIEMLEAVKIPNAEKMVKQYPHQLSGGMRQRVMIAMALACNPKLLIADEPTTALDVTVQGHIIALLKLINEKHGVGILFISHNLSVVRRLCSRVAVMHEGRIVEEGLTEEIYENPKHDYTKKLIDAIPTRPLL